MQFIQRNRFPRPALGTRSLTAKMRWVRSSLLASCIGLLGACAVAVPTSPSAGSSATPDPAKIAPGLQIALQGLAKGQSTAPNRPLRNTQGRIQVYVYVRQSAGAISARLQQAGMTHLVSVPELNVVEGWIDPSRILALTGLSFVTRITLPRYARPR